MYYYTSILSGLIVNLKGQAVVMSRVGTRMYYREYVAFFILLNFGGCIVLCDASLVGA